jgi:hypothetical protein
MPKRLLLVIMISLILGLALMLWVEYCCKLAWLNVAIKFGTVLTVQIYEAIAPSDFFSELLASNLLEDKDTQNAPSPDLIVTAQTGSCGQFSKILVSKLSSDNLYSVGS